MILFYHSSARVVECVSEYVFLILKTDKYAKKTRTQKKAKETKEEKRISPESRFKKLGLMRNV